MFVYEVTHEFICSWPGVPFSGSLQPAGAQHKTLILHSDKGNRFNYRRYVQYPLNKEKVDSWDKKVCPLSGIARCPFN